MTLYVQKLEVVYTFICYGSTLDIVDLDDEILHRFRRASSPFGRFDRRLWTCYYVSLQTNVKVYNRCAIPP